MKQSYAETVVKREKTLVTIGLGTLMVLGIIIGIILLFTRGFLSLLGAVIIVAIIYSFPMLNVEYEYIFVDGQLDFDRVTGNSKRKRIMRIDLDQVEIIAPVTSNALDSYKKVKYEEKDYSSRSRESKPYVIIASADNRMYKILFEPDEGMINTIRQKSPRKIVLY